MCNMLARTCFPIHSPCGLISLYFAVVYSLFSKRTLKKPSNASEPQEPVHNIWWTKVSLQHPNTVGEKKGSAGRELGLRVTWFQGIERERIEGGVEEREKGKRLSKRRGVEWELNDGEEERKGRGSGDDERTESGR